MWRIVYTPTWVDCQKSLTMWCPGAWTVQRLWCGPTDEPGCKSGYKQVPPSVTPALRQRLSGKTKTSQIWNLMVPWACRFLSWYGRSGVIEDLQDNLVVLSKMHRRCSLQENWLQVATLATTVFLPYSVLAFGIFCPLAGFEWISIMLSSWVPETSGEDLIKVANLAFKLVVNWSTGLPWNQVAFDRELPMPWDAATIDGHGSLAWVAVNSSKPQRERVPQCFMVYFFSPSSPSDVKGW